MDDTISEIYFCINIVRPFVFCQDKSADYSLNNAVGVKNNIFACLVLGIYEVRLTYSGSFYVLHDFYFAQH